MEAPPSSVPYAEPPSGAQELLAQCLELPTDAQDAALERVCQEHPELAETLRQAYSFVREAGLLGDSESSDSDEEASEECPMQTFEIEDLRILEKLGSGGMGDVWLAEQLGPVRRKVAVKLVQRGMGFHGILARFEMERQVLARMSHPCIAQVYGAGVTTTGSPYFLMEYVAGVPIHQYCDQKRLAVDDRLDLFIQVCEGVQHAHRRGIIHRDLKPSNVLVIERQGKPIPKIIDFGVAKAIVEKLTDETMHTEYGVVIGTPEYMSPEQAAGDPDDIDTRTDVYALGVMLYELLTGSLPFDSKKLRNHPPLEMVKILQETPLQRPSTRISHLNEHSTKLAHHRRTTPTSLLRKVRGDLDWVTMMAVEKDRERRYASAADLAADICRYRKFEPVVAGPPSTVYRLRKFLRRYRVQVGLAASLLVTLLAISGGYLWVRHDRETRRINAEDRVEKVLAKVRVLQALAEAASVEDLRPWERVEEELQYAASLATGFPELEAQIASLTEDLAKNHAKAKERHHAHQQDTRMLQLLAEIPVPVREGLDLVYDRKAHAERKIQEYRRAFAEYGIPVEGEVEAVAAAVRTSRLPVELSAALDDWAASLRLLGENEHAQRLQRIPLAADEDPWRTQFRQMLLAKERDLKALNELANKAKPDEMAIPSLILLARELAREDKKTKKHQRGAAIALLTRAWHAQPGDLRLATWLSFLHGESQQSELARGFGRAALVQAPRSARLWNNFGTAASKAGDWEEAGFAFRTATRLNPDFAEAWVNLGGALFSRGELERAIQACREAIRLKPHCAMAWNNLGAALREKGELEMAIQAYQEATRLQPDLALAWWNLGFALLQAGKLERAIEANREAIRLRPRADAWNNLGLALRRQGKLDDAIEAYREAIRLQPDLPTVWHNLGLALSANSNLDEAIAAQRGAIRLKSDHSDAWYALGLALSAKGDLDEAIVAQHEAIRLKPDHSDAWDALGVAFSKKGKLPKAIEAYREAVRLKPDYAGAWHNLGIALDKNGDLEGAIHAQREAIRLRPEHVKAWYMVGIGLSKLGRMDKAIEAYREVVRLKPDFVEAWHRLGIAFYQKAKLAKAIEAYREVVRLKPDFTEAWQNLGIALNKEGDLEEAIHAHREAIRLKPDYAKAWYMVGIGLSRLGRMDEAIEGYREAIRLKPDFAEAWCNLGNVLLLQCQYREALKHLQRGHELGSKQRQWPYPSKMWVERARNLAEQETSLLTIVRGETAARSGDEAFQAARTAYRAKLQVRATELFREAFRSKPGLMDDLQHYKRYNAACAAALAGCGQGKEVAKLDTTKLADLRTQALEWLRADLTARHEQLKSERSSKLVTRTMQHWQQDPDLAGIRDEAQLKKLGAEERVRWRALWKDVEALRKRAEEKEE